MTTGTTSTSAAAWRPDISVFDAADALPDALILNHSTVRGEIQGDEPSLRVAYVSDADAAFVDEGATISESDPALNEALVHTAKIAQLVRLSREQYRQNGTPEELARSVARALTIKADNAFLAQVAPTSPAVAPVAGLVNVSGIKAQAAVAALDKLINLEADVRSAGGSPTAWILAPDCWAALRKLKSATGSNLLVLGAGTDDAEPRILSIPVVINGQMPSKTGLLVDRSAVVSAVSQLEVAVDQSAYFTSDSVAIRATLRTGHVVPRPTRIGKFALSSS